MTFNDLNCTVCQRGLERYVWIYKDEYKHEAIRVAARWAGNPNLSFTWYDAATVCNRMRQGMDYGKKEATPD